MIKSRLAPTPSGFLHVGNAYNFLFAFLLVHKYQGALHLRIDDYDVPRVKQTFIDDLFRSLEWLGISWHSGPQLAADVAVYSQQQRFDIYHYHINLLKEQGQLFACSCSRKNIPEKNHYSGICIDKKLPFTAENSWRLLSNASLESFYDHFMKKIVLPDESTRILHPILKRKDGLPAYQLVSLIDDIEFGVNCIVRGEDLLPSSAAQIALSRVMPLNHFTQVAFYHHPLVLDSNGQKLSKSAGSFSLADFKQKHDVITLYRNFAQWLGIREFATITGLKDLTSLFNMLDY